MKILKLAGKEKRIVVKRFHLPAFGCAIVLQFKQKNRWKNATWISPYIMTCCSPDELIDAMLEIKWIKHISTYDLIVELFENRYGNRSNTNGQ